MGEQVLQNLRWRQDYQSPRRHAPKTSAKHTKCMNNWRSLSMINEFERSKKPPSTRSSTWRRWAIRLKGDQADSREIERQKGGLVLRHNNLYQDENQLRAFAKLHSLSPRLAIAAPSWSSRSLNWHRRWGRKAADIGYKMPLVYIHLLFTFLFTSYK